MNFANKGLPMEDPQCVRCSACVTHVRREFSPSDYGKNGLPVLDRMPASPVRMRESGSTLND